MDIVSGEAPVNFSALACPETEEGWAVLEVGTACYIDAGRKFIQAKRALKKSNGSFIGLVERLGLDLDAVERWMEIARHPVLSDSASLRNLPTAWTTLFQLSRISPKTLERYIQNGTVHPGLTCRAAVQLRKRDPNSNGSAEDNNHDGHHDRDGDADSHREEDHGAGPKPEAVPAAQSVDVGPDSRSEIERKLARLEELERETARQARQLIAYEREIEELKARLGPDIPIRAQRRLFQQAICTIQRSNAPNILEKESRFLRQSAATDLIELVRSAVRDGHKPDRFDLVYRPELH